MISRQQQGKNKYKQDALKGRIIDYDSSMEGYWTQQGTTLSRSQYIKSLQNNETMKNCVKCFPTFQGSIVLHINEYNLDKIVHCNREGLKLGQLVIYSYQIYVQAITPQLVLIVYQKFQPSQCEIIQWSLTDHRQIRISYLKSSFNYLSNFQVFPNSKIFYVIEQQIVTYELKANPKLRKVENVILHCYKYPLIENQNNKLFRIKHKVEALWYLSQNKYSKLDDTSKIAIFSPKNGGEGLIKIITHQIQSNQSKWQTFLLKLDEGHGQQIKNITLLDIYQVCSIQKQMYVSVTKQFKGNKIFNQYIWSYFIDQLRPSKFSIHEDHSIRVLGTSNISKPWTADILQNPVYYIDLKNERILAIRKNKKLFSNTMVYEKDREVLWTLLEFDMWNKKLQRIMVQQIKYLQYPINQLSTFLVLEKIPQCDEDLLQQIAQYQQQLNQ